MREIEQLKRQWNDSARFRGIQSNLHLDRNGLTLGAGTVVAKRNHDGSLALDGEDAKVLRRPPDKRGWWHDYAKVRRRNLRKNKQDSNISETARVIR